MAYELGLPFYRWDIRSTSKAKEGLYEFDFVLRLHDVQAQKLGVQQERDPSDAKTYRRFGALGKAFQVEDRPAVVLIDEIDKADLDFPNDLLTVLDDPWEFEIPETGEMGEDNIQAKHQPIVFISSNKEKGNLPAPFLRRCLYYYMKFPNDPQKLQAIVEAHYQALQADPSNQPQHSESASIDSVPSNTLTLAAAKRFLSIRQSGGLFKQPGTSEFLDWIEALHCFGEESYDPELLKTDDDLPYCETLFKLRADWQKYATG